MMMMMMMMMMMRELQRERERESRDLIFFILQGFVRETTCDFFYQSECEFEREKETGFYF